MFKFKPFFSSKSIGVFIYVIIIVTSLYLNKVFERKTNVITWDVYGYYLYLPATLTYHDTKNYHFTEEHFANYKISDDRYQLSLIDSTKKIYAPIYTMGMAILYSPFYIIGSVTASIFSYPNDGLSFPFQLAIVLASLIYAGLGIYYLRRFLLLFFEDEIVSLTLIVILLSTNYFHYAAFDSGMPHAYLFALYCAWLFQVYKWHEQPDFFNSFLIGLIAAVAFLARPSECIVVLVFLLYKVYSFNSLKTKVQFFQTHFKYVLIIATSGVTIVLLQIAYWKYNLGQWIFNGYSGHHFDYLKPHLWDGLFSYRKGWLVYTPVLILAISGFFISWRNKYNQWKVGVTLFVVLNIYIVFSWHIWWYCSTFGSRAVVQSYAFLAIPLAAFIQFLWQSKYKITRVVLVVFIGACLLLNQFQDWQYRQNILPLDATTGTYYWKIFGRTKLPLKDVRKYLDVDEKLPDRIFKENSLAQMILDTPQVVFKPNEYSKTIIYNISANEQAKELSNNWLRIKAKLWTSSDLFGQYDAAALVFSLERAGQNVKWTGVRFPNFIDVKKWEPVQYEVQLPALEQGDIIKVFTWNPSPDTILMKELELLQLQE